MKGTLVCSLLAFATACGSSENAPPMVNSRVTSDVEGASFPAAYGTSEVSTLEATDDALVTIVISSQPRSCDESSARPHSSVVLTLYVKGPDATAQSIVPDTYMVGEKTSGELTFECHGRVQTMAGLDVSVSSGTVTVDEATDAGYRGAFELTTDDGETASGTFDVPLCE